MLIIGKEGKSLMWKNFMVLQIITKQYSGIPKPWTVHEKIASMPSKSLCLIQKPFGKYFVLPFIEKRSGKGEKLSVV